MNLANLITVSRLLVTLGVLACLELAGDPGQPTGWVVWAAFWMFLYAALSDFADGWVARKYGLVTSLGRVIDPFADKFLICGSWICLLRFAPHTPPLDQFLCTWMIVIVVSREFLVTTLRGVAESKGVEFPADRLGKLKMVMQCVVVCAQLTMVAGSQTFVLLGTWGMVLTVAVTVVSGLGYLIKARPVLSG
ncbi:MAG: CDP-diacylglycerol--glycerol-3-phosphate 3-phosphatidyltransferase [Planctomycetota bacterium]|nr:CDP-diacylglycerol--glycerol-3-phosphate 3-phosphatidyltransferase [Planctomycetota bacterium]